MKLIGTVEQQKGPLTALTFSSDGIHLATADWKTAMIWKIADQTCQQTIGHYWSRSHDEVTTVAVSSNGEKVAAQFGDGRVYVWRVSDGFGVAATPLPSIMKDLAFGKGGDEIIAGGNKIQFTNCRTPNWKQSPTPYGQASSYRYTLSPDGRFAAIGILEKTQFPDALRKPQPAVIKVLNLQTGLEVNQIRPKHGVISMAISPSSPIIAVAGYPRDDGHTMSDISLWNFETGEL